MDLSEFLSCSSVSLIIIVFCSIFYFVDSIKKDR